MPETSKQRRAWDAWMLATDPRDLQRRFKRNFLRAQGRIGQDFVRMARQRIRGKEYAANAPLTVALKGSDAPLANDGDLLGDLRYRVEGYDKVRVGVGPSPKKGGREVYEIIHNGARVRVTRKMLIFMRARLASMEAAGAYKGRTKQARREHQAAVEGASRVIGSVLTPKKRIASGGGGGYWIIPPRPYIDSVIDTEDFQVGSVERHYGDALEETLTGPLENA